LCGGIFDFVSWPPFDPQQVTAEAGIWRYRHTFGLPVDAPAITLGEGDTPLIWVKAFEREVAFKLEFLNPSGSFKDRGTALLVSFLRGRGITAAMDDSSGNAGASFAAYAAAAGIKARIFLPAYASGPKREQISAYGAEVITVAGPRSRASEAVRKAAAEGAVYASHALLPQGLPGFGTTAYELVRQLGERPGTVIVPAGQGTQLLALGRAFRSLQQAGLIESLPMLVGVQARACAPLWLAFNLGEAALQNLPEGETLAEGVRIRSPWRMDALFQVMRESRGEFMAVEEDEILPGQRALARRGMFVEPTSAIAWPALEQVIERVPHPVVVILTGAGLKTV
jgi:threonine synthase